MSHDTDDRIASGARQLQGILAEIHPVLGPAQQADDRQKPKRARPRESQAIGRRSHAPCGTTRVRT
ncbi:hypothetical protein OG267_39660 [Kitasatospora herbaricolor]|uniref:hypothetical protein n=1 Tax=Kitasatospora herbaricolor TaxID=68217 RepID=UPI002E2EE8EE|nr:hypothetical protein [Kitasatospora herbaricolor]